MIWLLGKKILAPFMFTIDCKTHFRTYETLNFNKCLWNIVQRSLLYDFTKADIECETFI